MREVAGGEVRGRGGWMADGSTRGVEGGVEEAEKKKMKKVIKLQTTRVTDDAFRKFGQVVGPQEDGPYDESRNARLDLGLGEPRLYIMRLRDRNSSDGMKFTRCVSAGSNG